MGINNLGRFEGKQGGVAATILPVGFKTVVLGLYIPLQYETTITMGRIEDNGVANS
jgi:hypothetical protein